MRSDFGHCTMKGGSEGGRVPVSEFVYALRIREMASNAQPPSFRTHKCFLKTSRKPCMYLKPLTPELSITGANAVRRRMSELGYRYHRLQATGVFQRLEVLGQQACTWIYQSNLPFFQFSFTFSISYFKQTDQQPENCVSGGIHSFLET
jgi:hypothetical protein